MNQLDTTKSSSTSWMINCKEATKLSVIAEFEKLSIKQKIALSFHLFICKVCKYFDQQSKLISTLSAQLDQQDSKKLDIKKKQDIEHELHQLIEQGV